MKQTKIELVEEGWAEFLGEENIYSERSREELLEDDELSVAEEGWMIGYEEAE